MEVTAAVDTVTGDFCKAREKAIVEVFESEPTP
jgi:hypothetical protein